MKFQRLQNKAIKYAIQNDDEDLSIEEAHIKYKTEAINVRLHRRGKKTWNKLENFEPDLTERSLLESEDNTRKDHYWWARLATSLAVDEPEPIYT